jgi:hypothetical protein
MTSQRFFSIAVLFLLSLALSSCSVVGDIFEAGAWTGIVGLVLGVALVIWLISKFFGGSGRSNA